MTDSLTIRIVVGSLALVALLVVAGSIWLAHDGVAIPDALIAIGSSAVGAVAGILSRTSSG